MAFPNISSTQLALLLGKLSQVDILKLARRVGLEPPGGIQSSKNLASAIIEQATAEQCETLSELLFGEKPPRIATALDRLRARAEPVSKGLEEPNPDEVIHVEIRAVRLPTPPPVPEGKQIATRLSEILGFTLEGVVEGETWLRVRGRVSKVNADAIRTRAGIGDPELRLSGLLTIAEINLDGTRVYEAVPETTLTKRSIKDIGEKGIRKAADRVDVLVLTTTVAERDAVRHFLKPVSGRHPVRGSIKNTTLTIGKLGLLKVAHVECSMGSSGRRGSTIIAIDAIDLITPRVVLVLGIAFGADPKRQRLGDLLLAEAILPYEPAKISAAVENRGLPLVSGHTITQRFVSLRDSWDLLREDGTKVSTIPGAVLSGDKVISNAQFRDAVLNAHPGAIGGEMEGTGAYAAAASRNVEVLLVKSICDWADEFKNDAAQKFAAYASVSFAEHIFLKPDLLSSFRDNSKLVTTTTAGARRAIAAALAGVVCVAAVLFGYLMFFSPIAKKLSQTTTIRQDFATYEIRSDRDVEAAIAQMREFLDDGEVYRPMPVFFDLRLEAERNFQKLTTELSGQRPDEVVSELRRIGLDHKYPITVHLFALETVVHGPGATFTRLYKDGGGVILKVEPLLDDGGVGSYDDTIIMFGPTYH